jgi:S1-C subfamily serine protease
MKMQKDSPQIIHIHHSGLKKHHKWIIGSFSTIVVIYMIVSGFLFFSIFAKQQINYNELKSGITDINSKISELTTNVISTQEGLSSLGSQVGTIDEQFSLLKASAGEDFSGIIERVVPSVVTIRTDIGQGTGFIIRDEGYLVTNAHVLSGAKEVFAITSNQETIKAELVGYDSELDIVLLKISGNYDALELGDSDETQVGEKVIAIGNPLGLQFSVSQGIVSGVHRKGINGIEAYTQTDAALNPGNSGGPLINKEGQVIGINNFKIGGGESLGFALESNYIKTIVERLLEQAQNKTTA